MSLQLVQYSDSDDSESSQSETQREDAITKPIDEIKQSVNRKRKRTDHEDNESNEDSDADADDIGNEPISKKRKVAVIKKKSLKLSKINIEEKLLNDQNEVEFLNARAQLEKEFVVEKAITNKLQKIDQHNTERKEQLRYQQRLKQLEIEEIRKKEGLKRKKEHQKYRKMALKQHLEIYGEKEQAKQIGKGSHTKNQRVSW